MSKEYCEAVECILDIKSNYKFYAHNNRAIDYQCSVIVQALLTKTKKEEAFEKLQTIMDTWHTSYTMDNESVLREIDKIICEVLK